MMMTRFAGISGYGVIAAALAVVIGQVSDVSAATISQIPPGFNASAVEIYLGNPAAQSQFDADPDVGVGDVSNFATIYDNFTFGSNLNVTNFSWIGIYADDPLGAGSTGADSFTVSIFSDVAGEPGGALGTFNVGLANETAIDSTIYSYSADISPFAVNGGQQYWFSVVANMNADVPVSPGDPAENQWGVAFSDLGDDLSFQDFQTGPGAAGIERFNDSVDYAFSVTAVPEPATCLALSVLSGGAIVRRHVRRRKNKSKMNA